MALLSAGGAHLLDDAGESALSLSQAGDVLLEGFAVGAGFGADGIAGGLGFGTVGTAIGADGFPFGASLRPDGFAVGAGFDAPVHVEAGQCEANRDDGFGFLAELEHGSFHPRASRKGTVVRRSRHRFEGASMRLARKPG